MSKRAMLNFAALAVLFFVSAALNCELWCKHEYRRAAEKDLQKFSKLCERSSYSNVVVTQLQDDSLIISCLRGSMRGASKNTL